MMNAAADQKSAAIFFRRFMADNKAPTFILKVIHTTVHCVALHKLLYSGILKRVGSCNIECFAANAEIPFDQSQIPEHPNWAAAQSDTDR